MALIGWWKLDGDISDSSIYKHESSINGTITEEVGKIGACYNFSSGEIEVDRSDMVLNEDLSIAFWINMDSYPSSRCGILETAYGAEIALNINSNGRLEWYYGTHGAQGSPYTAHVTSGPVVEIDNWVHITLIRDIELRSTIFYKNGEVIDTKSLSYIPVRANSDILKIGRSYTGRLTGLLDDVQIYNHVLSPREIKDIMLGKVAHYKFDTPHEEDRTIIDSSRYGNHGIIEEGYEPVWVDEGKIGSGAYSFNGSDQYMNLQYGQGLDPSVYPHTFSLWARPRKTSSAMVISSGQVGGSNNRFYIAINSGRWSMAIRGTQWNTSGPQVELNKWVHLACVLDGSEARMYVDGNLIRSINYTPYTFNRDIYLGAHDLTDNYWFDGDIDDVRIYATALTEEDIKDLYQNRVSLDSFGNLFVQEITETSNRPLIMDYTIWEEGQTGPIGNFGVYNASGNNSRILELDPWGNETVVWKSEGPRCGIHWNRMPIDNTKLYRMSCWEKRVTNGTATSGSFYAGLNGYGSTNGVYRVGTTTNDTNPYFWNAGITNVNFFPIGEWVLVVGHVFPHDHTEPGLHPDSGRYTVDGRIGNNSRDFVWRPETTEGRSRTISIYTSDTSDIVHYSVYPRIDICDGTEPSIDDLLSGRPYQYPDIKQPFSLRDNTLYVANISEFTDMNDTKMRFTNKWDVNISGELIEI